MLFGGFIDVLKMLVNVFSNAKTEMEKERKHKIQKEKKDYYLSYINCLQEYVYNFEFADKFDENYRKNILNFNKARNEVLIIASEDVSKAIKAMELAIINNDKELINKIYTQLIKLIRREIFNDDKTILNELPNFNFFMFED